MVFERAGDAAREEVAINGEGGARGNFGRIGLAHDDRAKRAHFAMEQADGVAVAIVAAKAVRAHHFGERVALMRGRARKSVVWGRGVSVRVGLGGGRLIKKKKNINIKTVKQE